MPEVAQEVDGAETRALYERYRLILQDQECICLCRHSYLHNGCKSRLLFCALWSKDAALQQRVGGAHTMAGHS